MASMEFYGQVSSLARWESRPVPILTVKGHDIELPRPRLVDHQAMTLCVADLCNARFTNGATELSTVLFSEPG